MEPMHGFGPPLFYGPAPQARRGVDPGRAGPGGWSWDRSPGGWRCTRCPHARAWRPRWRHIACGPSPRASRGTSASSARSRGCTSWLGGRGEVFDRPGYGYTTQKANREVIELAVLNGNRTTGREPGSDPSENDPARV